MKAGVVPWRPRVRYDADLIAYPQHKQSEGYSHILVVQDVFSRKMWTRPLRSAKREEVGTALASILREAGPPQELYTDGGGEFQLGDLYQELHVEHVTRDRKDYATMSTLEAGIAHLKRSLALHKRANGQWQWGSMDNLQRVTEGENKIPRPFLYGASPDDVADDNPKNRDAFFSLEKEAAQRLQLNQSHIERRESALKQAQGFASSLRPTATNFKRGDQPNFEDVPHRVASVQGNTVIDEAGRRFQARLVRPRPPPGASAQQQEAHAREAVQRHAELIGSYLRDHGHVRTGLLAMHLRRNGVVLPKGVSVQYAAQLLGHRLSREGPHTFISGPAE